jgi:membrane-bound lytic murein transglycosylase B
MRLALPRPRQLVRAGAVASIAAGTAVFAAGAATVPSTAAHSVHVQAQDAAKQVSGFVDLVPPPAAPIAPAAANGVNTHPPRRGPKAPADPRAISSLAANGIPSVALNAYRVAAARMNNVDPGCRIGWWLIAGIGRVESDHGRFAGAVLHTDGISTPRIIGPALDGKHWDYIPAPANGRQLDGDATYAHALGPMQFIPSTWAIYGADETGDGKADVFNINDAALGTARYLCAAGGDLATQPGQVRAVLAYNHSDQYLAEVLALAQAYHRGLRVTGIPVVGITKGGLPTVVDTGYVPPANPGAPTAVAPKTGSKPAPKKRGTSTSPGPSGSPTSTAVRSGTSGTSGTAGAPAPSGSFSTAPTPSMPPPTTSSSCGLLPHLTGQC